MKQRITKKAKERGNDIDSVKDDLFVSLKPLRKAKKLREAGFYTFDCETKDGLIGKELFCWGLGMRNKGGKNDLTALQGYEDLSPLFEKLSKWKDKTNYKIIFVHNLTFDSRFLINYMANHDIEYYPIISGSNFLALLIDSLKVKFVDTVQYLQCSQEEAELEWNVDEELRKIDCKDLFNVSFGRWSVADKERVFAHNKNDVMALHQVMTNFRLTMWDVARVDVLQSVSLAGVAMKSFRKEMVEPMLNPFVFTRMNPETRRLYYDYDEIAERFVRASYYGGRTEVYNRSHFHNMIYYDKVSMYPGVMTQKLYPAGNPSWAKNNHDDRKLLMDIIRGKRDELALISVHVIPNMDEFYPTLPKRIEGKVMFMNCEFDGIYTSVELAYAYKRGYRFKIKPLNLNSTKNDKQWVNGACGLVYPDKADYFLNFVGKFFKVKSENLGGKRKAAKIVLNSCYGKFGEKFKQTSPLVHYFVNEGDGVNYLKYHENPPSVHLRKNPESRLWIAIELEETIKVKPYMNIGIATFITSYARLELISKIHELEAQGIQTMYCDTDSITVRGGVKLEISKDLGGWDIEQTFEEVKFLAPKAYISIKEGKPFLKLKGVPKSKVDEIMKSIMEKIEKGTLERKDMMEEIEKQIRQPIEMAERYMTFRESHRFGLILASKKRSKHYSFENLKRNFNAVGLSESWNIETLPKKFMEGLTITSY